MATEGPTFDPNTLYELREVAKTLGVPLYQLTNPAKAGELPVADMGVKTFVTGANILKFASEGKLKSRKNPGAVPPRVRMAQKAARLAEEEANGTAVTA